MSPKRDARALGRAWENRAAEFLAARGIKIICQGYRCRLGELDIVASDGDRLLIVEVKARARPSRAIETIGASKQRRIVNATRHFLMRNRDWFSKPIRFDVVAIDGIDTSCPDFQWVRNAFDGT
jgi:putative endonuclease